MLACQKIDSCSRRTRNTQRIERKGQRIQWGQTSSCFEKKKKIIASHTTYNRYCTRVQHNLPDAIHHQPHPFHVRTSQRSVNDRVDHQR